MKIAYLIHAHKNFAQLERLVAKLNHSSVDFYIHVDNKVDVDIHALFPSCFSNSNVTLIVDRVNVRWGGYSQVKATINGLRAIMASHNCYDYINFISGQDYPLKHNDAIIEFFAQNKGAEFINCFELSEERWPEGMMRFERYWFNELIRHEQACSYLQYALIKLLPKRKMPNGYKAYAGSQWWTLSHDCSRYILEFIHNNTPFMNFLKTTRCPDEFLFQTIIMNSRFKEQVCEDNLRYIDWSDGVSHPKTLTINDIYSIMCSNKLFARKFDSQVDDEVLDLIDAYISKGT